MKQKLLALFFFMLLLPVSFASNITLSLDQQEYFFTIGEDAVINLHSENTFDETINGVLSYTITQEINQGNFQYSSSNTKSSSFSIEKGQNSAPLNFGTSDTPMTFSVGLKFSYNENEAREVVLDDIKIHFVSSESQKDNQQNPVSGSSQPAQTIPQQQGPFAQQEQRIQQIINQINQNPSQQQPQSTEQRVQNNQVPQDSSALRKQLQQQAMEKERLEKKLLEKIRQEPQFQEFDKQLRQQGFSQQDTKFSQDGNKTTVQINYANNDNESAVIKAEIDQNTVQKIELIQKKESIDEYYWWLPIIAFLLIAILGYFAYKKFFKKKQESIVEEKIIEKPFDYKMQALSLLEKAEKSFEEKEFKEAYGKAGQAIRLYFSHKNGLKKEITNDEIIEFFKKHNKNYKEIKKCFDLCSLVEFAKYKANKKDFEKITSFGRKIII